MNIVTLLSYVIYEKTCSDFVVTRHPLEWNDLWQQLWTDVV